MNTPAPLDAFTQGYVDGIEHQKQATPPEVVHALTALMAAVVDTVAAAGPEGAPSGIVYVACSHVLPLGAYLALIETLQTAGFLRRKGDLLFWTGKRLLPPATPTVQGEPF